MLEDNSLFEISSLRIVSHSAWTLEGMRQVHIVMFRVQGLYMHSNPTSVLNKGHLCGLQRLKG